MSLFQAIILGVVQGVTEFFPVSSSGHLVILQALFGIKEPMLTFDIILHFGTLVSIAIFFHKDILDLFERERKTLLYLIIASIPTFIIAFLFKDTVEKLFGMPKQVGFMLLLTGAWLIFVTFRSKKITQGTNPGILNSFLIGVAQGIAIIPGISRSGATIGAGLAAGLKRETAFKFSFLLAIPAIAGACLFKAHKIALVTTGPEGLCFLAGGIAAAITGILTLKALLKLVIHNKLHIFGIYCIIAGIMAIILL